MARVRTNTYSSSETPTCVTALRRRSRRISQQMLALLSSSSHKDEHQEHLRIDQTGSQSWPSPSATTSRITLNTMGTMNNRTAFDRNNSGDIFDPYTRTDAQRDPRSMAYPPPQFPGHRTRPPRLGHTPSSSIGSSKHSPEPQMQPTTSPTKPMGPRAPNQPPSLRITDDRSSRRPPGTSTDAQRVQLAELNFSHAENSPHSSSAALSSRNPGQPASAPPTSRQSSRRNPRPAIVPPQDIPPGQYFNSHSSSPLPSTPASAPATFSNSGRLPATPRSRPTTTEKGATPTGRLPASSPQAPHHHRAMSDGIPGGMGSHIEPRGAHTQGGTGMSSGRPRSPRDVGIVGRGATPAHPSHHTGNASGQSSGSDYSESGQYAIIDHPNSQPQQASSGPVAQVSRDQTSFDADGRPAASFSMSPVPRSQRLQVDYFQQQTTQQPTSTDLKRAESTRGAHGEPVKAKKNSWQGAPDLRGSIADLWNTAVNAAEEEHRLELLQNSNGPLSSGSSGVLTSISEPSSYPSSVPSLAHLPSSGFSGRPGSRSGRENHGQPHVPQAPAIAHSNPSSPHDRSQNHHVTVSIPPVFTSQAGALPSPPRHIDIMPSYPPPPRPPRAVTDGSGSAVPSIANPSASAHGPTTSIPLKRPVSPHKPHTPPSPARPPPMPLARPPSPWKSPPPPPLSVSPAKSVPPPPPPMPAPRDQSPIKTPVPHPLSPASDNTNTSRLSIFAKPTASLPPVTISKSAPAPVPAPPSPSKPPASLPDPITKPRPLSPQPQSLVKPLQLRTKNSNNSNNSPLPPPPMQLPPLPPPPTGKENNRENTNATRENANKVVPPPRSRDRLPRADSDYSIVAISVKSGSTEGAADDEEDKHDKVKVEVEVQVKGLKAVDKRGEHVESSESEYSGSESPCVSVPRVHDSQVKASTDKRFLSAPNSASKVTSSTVAVVPTPSAPKLQLEDKTKDGSTGSLHLREAAESVSVNVAVEQAEVMTPKKDNTMLEELDATPTRSNISSAGNRGKVIPPVPVPVPPPVFSRRKEEVPRSAVAPAPSQPPPKSKLLNEPRVELRPISLGLIKPEDIMFHFSEAEHIRLASDEAPQRATYDHKPARPPPRVASPKRSASVKKPPGGHARRREAIPSSASECEGNTHEHRSRTNEERRTPAPSPDFGDPFATQSSSSSRPGTATTMTTSSASATGHASLLGWGLPQRKRSTRPGKRNTIVGRLKPGSTNLYGVDGDDDDADDDDDEDDDEFEVETEHGRVLKKLVKEKGSWPSAMSFHDVLSEPTISGRAQGYATKLNELSREDCGLGDWIEVWLKPKLFAGQLDIQPSGMSAHNRVASGASVFSDTTFPMRVDAFRAIDLSPGAGGGPFELGDGPPPLPYPSLAMKQLQQGSAYNFKSNANTSNLLPGPKKSTGFFSSLGRKASMKSKVPGDSSGQENRERRRKLYRVPPSGSSTSQLGHVSDIGNSSSKASLVPLAPSIVGGPRAPPGKPKRASTVLVIGPPKLIHPPPPPQYSLKPSKRSSLDAFMSAAASSSSTVALHQPMAIQTNIVPPAPEGPRLVTRTPSYPGHSSSSSSINRANGLTPPDANVRGGGSGSERRSKLRQAVSYQPPRQPSDNGPFEKSLDKLCDFMPDLEREVLADYLRQAGGQEMIAVGRIVDARKRGAITRP